MLNARKASVWTHRYEISADGKHLAIWDGSIWKHGGHFELDGRRYEVRGNMWGSKYGMVAADGTPVASAERVGRKRWTVEASGRPAADRHVTAPTLPRRGRARTRNTR